MGVPTLLRRGGLCRILVLLVTFLVVGRWWIVSSSGRKPPFMIQRTAPGQATKAFVVASRSQDDNTWLEEHLSDWTVYRYVVDNSQAQYTVPQNKGREAMVYLSYIIDAYDYLPDVVVFMHSDRYQWHNDDPLYDGVPMLKSLQLPYIMSQGYANIRCVWTLGCPSEIKLDGSADSTRTDDLGATQSAYKQAFEELFPGRVLPETVGVPCCAQFAVTRDTIRRRPVKDYERYRQWLLNTPLKDNISGRIFEYSWHIMFGKPYTHCPNAKDCYCNLFGLCNLECGSNGNETCGERWPFPRFSTLPKGWPTVGWDKKERGPDVLERLRNVAISSASSDRQRV